MKLKTLAAALTGSFLLALAPVKAEGPDKLVTILTAPEPQTQLMAMVLTMQSIQQDKSAQILLCGPAGDLALKDAPASATTGQAPKDMSPQGLMQKIMQAGGKVEVCAIYLPNKGAGPDALLDGITVAKPPAMAAAIMADNTRVMSF
jgi:predicted peroxiredoxin